MFTITDKEVQARESVTWLRCECGVTEVVYDQPDDDRARDEAARQHECPPVCLLCAEPLPANDVRIGARIDLDCWRDQPTEAALALGAFIEARNKVA